MQRLDRIRKVALASSLDDFLKTRGHGVLVSRHVVVGELRRVAARPVGGKMKTMVHARQQPSNLVLQPVGRERWAPIRSANLRRSERWLTLGRDGASDVVVNDYTVSLHHARISVIPRVSRVILEDLNSTNGTAHNGVLIEPGNKVMLVAGDSICFGRMEMAFFTPKAFYSYLIGAWTWSKDEAV